jgi:hypothetical protein
MLNLLCKVPVFKGKSWKTNSWNQYFAPEFPKQDTYQFKTTARTGNGVPQMTAIKHHGQIKFSSLKFCSIRNASVRKKKGWRGLYFQVWLIKRRTPRSLAVPCKISGAHVNMRPCATTVRSGTLHVRHSVLHAIYTAVGSSSVLGKVSIPHPCSGSLKLDGPWADFTPAKWRTRWYASS